METAANPAPTRNEFLDSLSGRNEFIDSLSGRNQFLDSLSGYRIDGPKPDAQTIFVPSSDDDLAAEAAVEPIFEDVEADDVFEQSLSGLRIEEVEEIEAVPETRPLPLERPEPAALATDPPAAVAEVEEQDERPAFVSSAPTLQRRRWSWLRSAAAVLIAIASFAAGSAATMYLFELPPEIPNAIDLPLIAADGKAAAPDGMVYVPGGEFTMGSDDGEAYSRPSHLMEVRPFYIDQTEVTNDAYFAFIKATGHDAPAAWVDGKHPAGEARFPVTGVTWYDAAEFAAWSGKRLPTEAEWEFAARGSDGRIFPWGNEWDASSANAETNAKSAREVGLGAKSPFGAYDMTGNVWEWTASDAKGFPGGKQIPWSRHRLKIIRGGNWQSDRRTATTFFRGFYGASGEKDYKGTGFRCVKDGPRER